MSASTQSFSSEDLALGTKVISYSIQALGFAASLALASACSSTIVAIIVAIVCTVVLTLLGAVAAAFVTMAMDVKHVAYVGATTNSVISLVSGLFTRKQVAA